MKNVIKKLVMAGSAILMASALMIAMPDTVKADEAYDAQLQQLQLLMQTPEYQAALKAQQEAQAAFLAQQQQLALQAQAAALAQYQQAWQQQYAAAQLVYNNALYLQQMAVNQTYLLNSIQAQQRANYEAMVKRAGLDYQNMLIKDFTDDQYKALKAFTGYYGF